MLPEKEKEKLKEPSEEFRKAVRDGGTCVATCELCGREHFAYHTTLDWDPKYLEDLAKREEKEPDKYVGHGDDDITTGHIDGKQIVIDCPCNKLRRFENWIWSHRHIIIDYLNYRTRGEVERAQWERERLEEAGKFVEPMQLRKIRL